LAGGEDLDHRPGERQQREQAERPRLLPGFSSGVLQISWRIQAAVLTAPPKL
jgi:hypothetical protein